MENSNSTPVRVLIADDHDLVRDTIAAFLEAKSDFEVIKAASLDEVLGHLKRFGKVGVVLLDYDMPGMNGLDGLARVLDEHGGNRVALMSGAASRAVAEKALKMGAAGYLPKTIGSGSIVAAINFMLAGQIFAPFDFMFQEEKHDAENLTKREKQVLEEVCEGKSNKEIARDLEMQEATVKMHVRALTRKLDAKNRTHVAMIARKLGLV